MTIPRLRSPGEVRPSGDFYTYEAKYIDERSELIIPAHLPEDIAARVRQLAVQAYKAIDCAGMARADFLLDPTHPGSFPGRNKHHPGLYENQHVSQACGKPAGCRMPNSSTG